MIGTFGQVPEGRMTLIETAADAETIAPADPGQPRLPDPDHAFGRRHRRDRRHPARAASPRSRGRAARTSATRPRTARRRSRRSPARCDAMLVIGSPNSSNSLRLVEVAEREGAQGAAGRPRRRHRFRLAGGRAHARHHRRRLGARSCWSARWSTALGRALRGHRGAGRGRRGADGLQAARRPRSRVTRRA